MVNDEKEGEGTLKYASGTVQNGFWKKGLKHGKGKMTKASGVVKKEGNWLNDMFIG